MRIPFDQLRTEIMSALLASGMEHACADPVCEEILFAQARGKDSHGLNMLETMIARGKKPHGRIEVIAEDDTSCLIDGHGNVGPAVAQAAMDKAIEKAKAHHIAVVAVRNPSPFLTAGYHAWRAAAEHNMVAFAISVAKSKVAPHGTTTPIIGTNPIGFAFPSNPYPVVIDMAITKIPAAEIAIAQREGRTLPEGAVFNSEGEPTVSPEEAKSGALIPFGGYKGSALGIMVELLCGALIESKCGLRAGDMRSMLFIAVAGDTFAPLETVKRLAGQLREDVANHSSSSGDPARLPGDRAQELYEAARAHGVHVADEHLATLRRLQHTEKAEGNALG